MEKPVTVDGPTSKRMFTLGEAATKKNLKVGVGLMSRHSRAMQELAKRVHDGAIGEIVLQRGYRMHGPVGYFESCPTPRGTKEVMYQIQRIHSFLWASGGNYSDFYIHVIDHLCWMKNAWPVKAQALGGRHYRMSPEGIPFIDQNFDTYSVEYTYPDGTKLFFDGRCMVGCEGLYASYLHGSKGSAVVSKAGDIGEPSSIYKTQSLKRPDLVWESKIKPGEGTGSPLERTNAPGRCHSEGQAGNEVKRGVEASLVTSMNPHGRSHRSQEITFNDMLNCKHEFAPGLDNLNDDSPAFPWHLTRTESTPCPTRASPRSGSTEHRRVIFPGQSSWECNERGAGYGRSHMEGLVTGRSWSKGRVCRVAMANPGPGVVSQFVLSPRTNLSGSRATRPRC